MYFLDTSALAKRYVMEKGSPWIRSLAPIRFIVAAITHAEIYSALARQLRSGTLLPADHTKLIHLFDYDMERRFRIIDVTREPSASKREHWQKNVAYAPTIACS